MAGSGTRPLVDPAVIAAGSVVLFLLVLWRLRRVMGDLSEHRRTERALREAETKYRTLVESLPAIVYTAELGPHGRWQYVSPQVQSILGFTAAEWTADPEIWHRRIHPEDRARALADESVALLTGRLRSEYRMHARNGRLVWIRDEAETIRDDRGTPMYLQGVMYDVSDQKRAEETLRVALDREREASERLRSLDQMKNWFLEAVSHDLRTPLTSILGMASTLQNDKIRLSAADQKDMARRITANAWKLTRLLSDLLDLDRLAQGVLAPKRQRVNVREVVAAVLEECDVHDREVRLSGSGVVAEIDVPKVERIVENLVVNAVRYTPEDTPIDVTIGGAEGGVLLAVEDRGPGIPEDLRATIFEPFRQGAETIAHAPGVGIGLTLVARFAELHGGRAWVEDRMDGGASFKVFLAS